MPLIHGKSKKSFSENVATEMEHGKPQNQALAIAYSTMRKAGHKMSDGGMCEKCGGGSCKYSSGGEVTLGEKGIKSFMEKGEFDVGSSDKIPSKLRGIDEDEMYSRGGMVKKDTDQSKGVHKPMNTMHPEMSKAGYLAREHSDVMSPVGPNARETFLRGAKEEHKEKLNELKSMPKPKLEGLSDGGEVDADGDYDGDQDSDMDTGLMDQCCEELLQAIESKNKKEILESLKAIILSVKG